MLDESVEVIPFDPRWIEEAAQEILRLENGVGALVVEIEHFGSTSVPGCDAKWMVV